MRRAIVIGRARGVWEEAAALQAMAAFDATILVGKAAIYWPGPITHWVSFHPNLFPKWSEERREQFYPEAGSYWTSKFKRRLPPDLGIPMNYIRCDGGSSGLIGVLVALEEVGAERVALAGIPLENARGHVDEEHSWDDAQNYWQAWTNMLPALRGKVRSMSGWTMRLLGGEPPTREWLGDDIDIDAATGTADDALLGSAADWRKVL